MDIKLNLPIMLALCLMLLKTYYAHNYAGIIGLGLQGVTQIVRCVLQQKLWINQYTLIENSTVDLIWPSYESGHTTALLLAIHQLQLRITCTITNTVNCRSVHIQWTFKNLNTKHLEKRTDMIILYYIV